jgi:hypothetical protein
VFLGAIPGDLQAILSEHTRSWPVDEVWVGCSGAFTIERVLANRGWTIHSNDVSIYSCAIGSFFAQQAFRLEVREEFYNDWGWLADYMAEPVDALSTLLLCSQMLQFLGKPNPYYERLMEGFKAQWDSLHAKTSEKLSKVEMVLADFAPEDVREYMARSPLDDAVCCFPPFYAGGYETMFAPLGKVFSWDEPEYPVMDQDGLHELLGEMREHRYWLYGTDHRLEGEEHEACLRGVVQPTPRNVPIYVYSSAGATRVALPSQKITVPLAPKLGPDDEIGEQLKLAPLTYSEFNWLRSQYLNPAIPPSVAELPYAVLVDGKIVGAFAFGQFSTIHGPGSAYMISDFPVAPTKYRRLSKLIVMAALSREAKLLAERHISRRIRTLSTTAFTAKPVSMKYRGVLRLYKKTENPPSGYKFQLEYTSERGPRELGSASLAEVLAEWKQKYGDV